MTTSTSGPWRLLAGVAVVMLVTTLAFVFWWGSAVPPDQVSEAGAPGAASHAGGPALATRQPAERHGTLRSMAGTFAFETDLAMTTTSALGAVKAAAKLHGVVEFLGVSGGGQHDQWLVGRLLSASAEGDQDLIRRLEFDRESGTGEFAVRVDPRGEIRERRFDARSRVGERNWLAAVAASLQVVQAEDPRASRWNTTEEGASGTQKASYQADDDGNLAKTWRRSDAVAAEPRAGPAADSSGDVVSSGRAELKFAQEGLSAVTIEQRVAVQLGLDERAPQHYDVVTTTKLRRTAGLAAPPPVIVVGRLSTESTFDPPRARPVVVPSGRSVSAVLDGAAQASERDDWLGRREAVHELAANLSQGGKGLDQARAILAADQASADDKRNLVEALGSIGWPGRSVLREVIIDRTAPRSSRWHAAALLVTMQAPEPGLLDALMDVAGDHGDEVQVTAAAALAAVVHRAVAAGQAASVVRENAFLIRHAKACIAQDTELLASPAQPRRVGAVPCRISTWLMALGNLGGTEIYPLVLPYVVDRDEMVRRTAIEALRWIPTKPARLTLIKAMRLDPVGENRRQAIETALYHPQYLMEEHVVRALREDGNSAVQIGAGHVLAVWAVTTPGLLLELAQAADRATDPEVAKILGQQAQGQTSDPDSTSVGAAPAGDKKEQP